MSKLVIHPKTEAQLTDFLHRPSHALLLVGPMGSGKASLSRMLATTLLQLPTNDSVALHPYVKIVEPTTASAISIEAIRELEHFLSLKVPGNHAVNRVVIIDNSHNLTIEAQNALLKILEEPPVATVLLLTTNQEQALLATVRSRTQKVQVIRPSKSQLSQYFQELGWDEADSGKAYALSGGLPGLMHALLANADHPLVQATDYARRLLQVSRYDRLVLVDELSKQRELAIDVCFILQQMAHVSLQTATNDVSTRWQGIEAASYEATRQLSLRAQPKLALTNLMLNLS
jgi:hypothetical protein